MTPLPGFSETASILCILLILLVPLAAAGLALINAGLSRASSAAHSMIMALCLFAVAALTSVLVGLDWIGAYRPFFDGLGLAQGSTMVLMAWLQMLMVGLAALIPLGAAAERWRLGVACASTLLLAAWTYPWFAYWTWGGGWLSTLGLHYRLGRGFIDVGGSGSIQVVGGLTALSLAWILGPRRGKYGPEGVPVALPGHNVVFVLFGCFLALLGWQALNSAAALLFFPFAIASVPLIAVNTTVSAISAALATLALTRLRFGKPDASLTANGWIAGLVASSASCALIRPAEAVIVGAVAGALVTFSVELLELRLGVDDPGGAVSVHAVGGLWGILAVAFFAHFPDLPIHGVEPASGITGQWLAQVVGIATLLGLVLPVTYGLNWLLNLVLPQRVSPEAEQQGLDLHELGADAYPDFLTHSEQFRPR